LTDLLVTYVGGPYHHRTEHRADLATEDDVRAAVRTAAYTYRGSITSQGGIVEAIFIHDGATEADYESRESEIHAAANSASRIF